MPLTAEGSPLVSGVAKQAPSATVKVRVLRAFLIQAKPQKVGAEIEMDRKLALELHGLNKVEFVKAAPVEAAKPKKES